MMKKWTSKKLFIIVIDVFTVISLLLQVEGTAAMYYKAITEQWHTLPSEPLRRYYGYGLWRALFGASSLIRSYAKYAYDRDIYYSIAEAVVNHYSLQILMNVLRCGLIITFFMSFAVIVMKIRGRKKGEKYLLPVAVNILYVVMRIIGAYQWFIWWGSQ